MLMVYLMLSQVKFIMIGGPSGIGKTTLIDHFLTIGKGFYRPKTYTTRPKRSSDQPEQFGYLSNDDFNNLRDAHFFVQVDEVLGNLYGMAVEDFGGKNLGAIAIKEIHAKDHQSFKQHFPKAVSTLILPSDWEAYRVKLLENSELDASRSARTDQEIEYHSTICPQKSGADVILINDRRESIISLADRLFCELQKIDNYRYT